MLLPFSIRSFFFDSMLDHRPRLLLSIKLSRYTVSAVLKLHPYNPANPRYLRFQIEKSSGMHEAVLEFDTEESAMEWHREFDNALVRYRIRRRQALYGENGADESHGPLAESEDNTEGVRICVPLHRIDKLDVQPFAEFAIIATMTINMDVEGLGPLGPAAADAPSRAHCPPKWGPSSSTPMTYEFEPPSNAPTRELKLLVFKHENGPFLPDYICLAKERRDRARRAGKTRLESDVVTVDFGPLTFVDEDEKADIGAGLRLSHTHTLSGTSTPSSGTAVEPIMRASTISSSTMTPSSSSHSHVPTPGLKHAATSSSVTSIGDGLTKGLGRKAKLEKKMREMFAIDPDVEVFSKSSICELSHN